ncbi:MAG: A/G-specific adenine glycosylase [Micromonosporaceae bacterium]|nr:A/G-specific adenine glycosylase [Micromonosporaceae bacterium]
MMLQQTQVSRVEPVWLTFSARWPSPAALAAEPVSEIIRAWGRLGYPRRAVRLHACAATLVARHAGQVPSDLRDLLSLPGIGAYTARAVAVFAYRQRHPVVDTNVRRVVARVLTGQEPAGRATTAADLLATETLLPEEPEAAALASIAFMELGALVCTASGPKCRDCPLLPACALVRRQHAEGPARRAEGPAGVPQPPAPTQPSQPPERNWKKRPAQRYLGTDRHVRGLLLAVLREATEPVPATRLDLVWHDPEQRDRALASLVTDGLAQRVTANHYALPS